MFIDEAGHATEPETLIPLAGILKTVHRGGQIVMAGDPKQLGPVLRSPIAIKHGLERSLIERLIYSSVYGQDVESLEGDYDKKILTKLTKNYRSHPVILDVPNRLFYNLSLIHI